MFIMIHKCYLIGSSLPGKILITLLRQPSRRLHEPLDKQLSMTRVVVEVYQGSALPLPLDIISFKSAGINSFDR